MVRTPLVCLMKQKGQALSTALGEVEPEMLRMKVLLPGLDERGKCHRAGDRDLLFSGAFQPCQNPPSSLLQAVLHWPMPAPLSLQAADTHLAFPASSPLAFLSLQSHLCTHGCLCLETQSHGLSQTPSGSPLAPQVHLLTHISLS